MRSGLSVKKTTRLMAGLLILLVVLITPLQADNLYYRVVTAGSVDFNEPEPCFGGMRTIIAGNGNLLSSNALPTDLIAIAASDNVDFANSSVNFTQGIDSIGFSGSFTDQDITLISTEGTVQNYEINAQGEANGLIASCFDYVGSSSYITRFSYDTSAIGVVSAPSEVTYPLLNFSITFDGREFLAPPGATITVKDNDGQDVVRLSARFPELSSYIKDAQKLQIEIAYDTLATGNPTDPSTTEFPMLDFKVSTDTQSYTILPGKILAVKDNVGQDLVKFTVPLKSYPPITFAQAELTIAGSGSLLPAGVPPSDLLAVLASPEVQFTVARISFRYGSESFIRISGSPVAGQMTLQSTVFRDGFENTE